MGGEGLEKTDHKHPHHTGTGRAAGARAGLPEIGARRALHLLPSLP